MGLVAMPLDQRPLKIALGLNQLMIPKQGEFTYDTFCFGLGGGVTRVMQGQYTRITTFF